LCIACAQQTAVIVNRPVEIEQIAMTGSQNLSGQERCGIISEHTSVVYLMIHDANNQLKDNWQELLHEHIRNMEVIMEKFKVKCLNTRRILTDETAKELTKLSPDERAQYVRDANKVQRQLKSEAANPEKKEKAEAKEKADSQKAYKKMMASLLADTRTRRPQATDDELQKIVDKKMKLYQDALESED
jgi:ABC-type transporter lipoprotein component MlaA